MKSELIDNRQIRVFISSTFVDMAPERDYLVQNIFPILRQYCEERDVSFQEIDLLWGISEEDSKQGKVVDICLKEISNTSPFFVGLLGSRYGWIPDEKEREKISVNTGVFEDYPWLEEELKNGTSITEIEIQEGVLRAENAGEINAYFYFRSDTPKMAVAEEFKEKPGSIADLKLKNLKTVIRKQKPDNVMEYEDIESLGHLVEKDFRNLVDKLFPKGEIPSEIEKIRLDQRICLKKLCSVYIPDTEYKKNSIDVFVDSAVREVVIYGSKGSGKSAFIANWIRDRKKDRDEKIIYHFIGQGDEGDYRKISRRLIDEIRDIYKLPADSILNQTATDSDSQKKELENLLFSIHDEGRLIIILDGVDKLSDSESKKFKWLPLFPDNVKFIFSTTKEDPSMDYFLRIDSLGFKIKSLDIERRKVLIKNYLDLSGKKLLTNQIDRIASDNDNENPFVLRLLLDELRVFGKFDELDAKIDYYLKAQDIPELFTLVLERCENTYNQGKNYFVQEVLSLLYVSQQGLTETEIITFTGAAPLFWAQLFNGIINHLIVRNGMIMLAHEFIRDAVKKRYLPDDEAVYKIRMKLVNTINSPEIYVSPQRKYKETAYQLFEQANWDSLFTLLLDFEIFEYLNNDELSKYWGALTRVDNKKYSIWNYLKLPPEGRSPAKLAETFVKLCVIAEFYRWYSVAISFIDIAILLEPENAESYMKRGNIYQYNQKDPVKAVENYNKALEIKPDYSDVFYNRGNIAYAEGKTGYSRAIADYTAAIEINSKNSLAYNNRGIIYKLRKEYNKAEQDFTDAIRYSPNFAFAYNNRARTYFFMREYDKAINDATEAIHLDPNSKAKVNGYLIPVRNAQKIFQKFSFFPMLCVLILMVGVSFSADRLGYNWLYSVAIIANLVGIVWLIKTFIVGLVKRIRPTNLFFFVFWILRIVSIPLDIGLSVHYIRGQETKNPVSIFLQNPFKAAVNIFNTRKDNDADLESGILTAATFVVNSKEHTVVWTEIGVKND